MVSSDDVERTISLCFKTGDFPAFVIVIVVAPRPEMKMSDAQISEIVNDIAATSMKSAAADLAARTGISKKEAYKRLLDKGGADD